MKIYIERKGKFLLAKKSIYSKTRFGTIEQGPKIYKSKEAAIYGIRQLNDKGFKNLKIAIDETKPARKTARKKAIKKVKKKATIRKKVISLNKTPKITIIIG